MNGLFDKFLCVFSHKWEPVHVGSFRVSGVGVCWRCGKHNASDVYLAALMFQNARKFIEEQEKIINEKSELLKNLHKDSPPKRS